MKGDIDDTQVDLCGVQRANEERMSLTWSQHVPTTHLPSPSSHRPLPKTTAPQWLNPYTFLSCFIITYSQLPGTYTAPPNNSHPNWKRSKPGLISTNRRMKPPWGWPQAPHNPSLKKGKQPIDKLPQIVDVFACLKETPFYLWFGSLSLSLSLSVVIHQWHLLQQCSYSLSTTMAPQLASHLCLHHQLLLPQGLIFSNGFHLKAQRLNCLWKWQILLFLLLLLPPHLLPGWPRVLKMSSSSSGEDDDAPRSHACFFVYK